MEEIWKYIENCDNKYMISNKGNVVSYQKSKNGRLLKPDVVKGHLRVSLTMECGLKKFFVHRLVAQAFIPNPENKPQVNHIDGDKRNNVVENLEWCTPSENTQHAYDNGLNDEALGSRHWNASLSKDIVLGIRRDYSVGDTSYNKLSLKYGVSKRTIGRIVNRQSWKHV